MDTYKRIIKIDPATRSDLMAHDGAFNKIKIRSVRNGVENEYAIETGDRNERRYVDRLVSLFNI